MKQDIDIQQGLQVQCRANEVIHISITSAVFTSSSTSSTFDFDPAQCI